MAGCSIVFLMMFIFWPFLLVMALVYLVVAVAEAFITSLAFPLLLGAALLSSLAAIDLIRIVWHRYREGESYVITKELFVRPAVLAAIAFVLFVAMCVVCGSLILSWSHGISTSAASLI